MSNLIDRQAAIDALVKTIAVNKNPNHDARVWEEGMNCALTIIGALPSAQPERDKGEWILCTESVEEAFHTGARCSNCNYWKPMGIWNFCPNCGADMRGEQP